MALSIKEAAAAELIATDIRAFYNSRAWRSKAKLILKRDRYECQEHKRRGKYRRAECVHHKLGLQEHPSLAFADDNLESLCKVCHNEKHDRASNLKRHAPKFTTPERW